jgi:flavodoxin
MKTAILYYSFNGATRTEAAKRAASTGADVYEVLEAKKRGLFSAFLVGCPQALGRKASAIKPLDIDWSLYDSVTLMAPVWAGHPAPAFNAALELIPKDKLLHVALTSGGGETPKSKEATIDLLRKQGFTLASYEDVKSGQPPKKA